MAGRVKIDIRQLKEFEKNVRKLSDKQLEETCIRAITEIAGRYLRAVSPLTPVGEYTDGRVGGTLRRGWEGIDIVVKKVGTNYVIELENDVKYASYVNYGHRTRNGGWVEGRFFAEVAAEQIERQQRSIVERQVLNTLRGVF